ncbi:hypothetical protein MF069_36600, partial [Paenibacillus mucilaginosus]|nr:hypothetical protein [Paenibacillus mucilaginosus]
SYVRKELKNARIYMADKNFEEAKKSMFWIMDKLPPKKDGLPQEEVKLHQYLDALKVDLKACLDALQATGEPPAEIPLTKVDDDDPSGEAEKKHGGPRQGAGRKKIGQILRVSITLPPSEIEYINKLVNEGHVSSTAEYFRLLHMAQRSEGQLDINHFIKGEKNND